MAVPNHAYDAPLASDIRACRTGEFGVDQVPPRHGGAGRRSWPLKALGATFRPCQPQRRLIPCG